MKKVVYLFAWLLNFAVVSAQSPTCNTLQPDGNAGIDANVHAVIPNSSFPVHNDFEAVQWTYSGVNHESKGLLAFDLSAIPVGATVTSAHLSLYANTTSSNGVSGSPMWGNNASNLKLVTSPWTESVTWNTQPTATTSGQILLATSTSATQDYTNIDITSWAQQWVANPSQNYGMQLDMITTSALTSMIFASSDHADPTKRPKLVICYTLAPSGNVPTLSEWGLIILGLLTITLALAFMLYGQSSLAVAGMGNSFAPIAFARSIPFNKQLFAGILKVTLPVAMLGFIIVHYLAGTNGTLDFIGTIACTAILSYMTQLVLGKKN